MVSKRKPPQPPSMPESVPCPPERRTPFIRVVWAKEERNLDVILIGRAVYGMPGHWYEGRTIPCDGSEHACPGCNAGLKPRWYGFAAAVELPHYQLRIVLIQEAAYRNCEQLRALEGRLRGTAWRFQRRNASKRSPVHITALQLREERPLPQEFDVPAALARLWDRSTRWVIQQVRGVDEPAPDAKPKPGCRKKGGRSDG